MVRVVIVAEIPPGGGMGGVEQAIIGLAHGLSHLTDGQDEYIFTVLPWARDWLLPYVGPRGSVVVRKGVGQALKSYVTWRIQTDAPASLKATLRRVHAKTRTAWRSRPDASYTLQRSDGLYESFQPDVLHFPYQHMVLSSIPTVFGPFDLQHLHHPEFFTTEQIQWRDYHYRAWCHHSAAVEVASQWARADFINQYGLDDAKVHAIARGSALSLYDREDVTPEAIQHVPGMPPTFCLYPAQTWPHKNHVRLLEALASLRDNDGITLHLVCTGRKNHYWPEIARHIQRLGLERQVTFPGFVSAEALRSLYGRAEFVVYPTLFEGGGLPVLEALSAGVPLACSNATCLPEQVGDAAILFDPLSVSAISATLRRLHQEPQLRASLRERGRERAQHCSWTNTGKHFRALYRLLAGHPLTQEDGNLVLAGQRPLLPLLP